MSASSTSTPRCVTAFERDDWFGSTRRRFRRLARLDPTSESRRSASASAKEASRGSAECVGSVRAGEKLDGDGGDQAQ
jgi:hypothetical protein